MSLDPSRFRLFWPLCVSIADACKKSWYQDWYLVERERFQHMLLVILDKLMADLQAKQVDLQETLLRI